MRLLFCGSGWFPIVDVIRAGLMEGARIEIWDRAVPLVEAVRAAQVILPSNARIDAAVIAAAPELALIQQPAAGVNNIAIEAARERGIPVCNAPGANHIAVAEAALFLLLALARRQPLANRAFAAAEIGGPLGRELCGKTLAVIGMGRSGSALAERARGIGMNVIGVRSRSAPGELRAALTAADAISLHVPLTPETRHMIDAGALGSMKPGVLLVNCARGPIIDRAALQDALASNHLGGVGLDVFWDEPWDPGDPLFAHDAVVTLPHVAGSTAEAFGRIAAIVCENVARVARAQTPLHIVS